MPWIAPTNKDAAGATLEKRLWDAADPFRANAGLNAQKYFGPILGLTFLRFAEVRFTERRRIRSHARRFCCTNGASSHQPWATPWELAVKEFTSPERAIPGCPSIPACVRQADAAGGEIEKAIPQLPLPNHRGTVRKLP
jgi:type I restriction enzyme M protein